MIVDVKATLETRTSKAGNEYQVLVIKIDEDVEKHVFLEAAEIKLLKMAQKSKENQNNNYDPFA